MKKVVVHRLRYSEGKRIRRMKKAILLMTGAVLLGNSYYPAAVTAYASPYRYYSDAELGRKGNGRDKTYYIYSIKGNTITYRRSHWVSYPEGYGNIDPYGKLRKAKLTKKTKYYVGNFAKYAIYVDDNLSEKVDWRHYKWIKRVRRKDLGTKKLHYPETQKSAVYYKKKFHSRYSAYSVTSTTHDYLVVKNGKVKLMAIGLQISD